MFTFLSKTFLIAATCFFTLSMGVQAQPSRAGGANQRPHPIKNADADQDGRLSLDEFSELPKLQQADDNHKQRLFQHLDKNADGYLTQEELPVHQSARPQGPQRQRLRDLDTNNDRQVTQQEFLAGVTDQATQQRRTRLFQSLDRNQDGVLSPADHQGTRGPRPQGQGPRSNNQGHRPNQGPRPNGPARQNQQQGRPQGAGKPALFFKQLDTNGDSQVSFEEFSAGERASHLSPERQKKMFDRLDTNQDGVLTPDDKRPSQNQGRNNPRGSF